MTLYAAHTDMLVLGIGPTEGGAIADAFDHGAEDESLLDTAQITPEAAAFVEAGGDCRALVLTEGGDGDLIALAASTPPTPRH